MIFFFKEFIPIQNRNMSKNKNLKKYEIENTEETGNLLLSSNWLKAGFSYHL